MSYAMPPQQQSKPGKPWLLIIGVVVLLLSLVLCGVGGLLAARSMSSIVDAPEQSGSQVVALEQGEDVAVWSRALGNTCTASGPSGPVQDSSKGTSTISWGDKQFERVMSISADEAGDYTVSCTSPFVVGDQVSVGGIVTASIGSALCCLAVVLTGIGLVLWLAKRRR